MGKGSRPARGGDSSVKPYKRRGKQQHLVTGPALTADQDREIELATRLQEALNECSRQRLRSLQMSLRRYGNLDCRIQTKDLQQAFQDSNIKISSRTFQLITQKFDDQNGVDYEQLWLFLRRALYNTGRDSIRAILATNITDTTFIQKQIDSDRDKDLIERLKEQFDENEFAPNLESFRAFLRENDTGRCGKVPMHTVLDLVKMIRLPVHGSLLKALINTCDTEHNCQINWPEMMNLLDTAWSELKAAYPDVANRPFPKELPKTSTVNLSGIQKRLLKKGASITGSDTDKQTKKSEEKARTEKHEEEKRPSSKGGFFKSVRGFLGTTKKKQASPERSGPIPVIQVEKETKNQIKVNKPTETNDYIEVTINDTSHKIYCPDVVTKGNTDPPKERLKLDWIYGYGGRRDGSRIEILGSQEIVYHISNTVVLYDFDKHHQRHYREHTEEIRALTVHPDGVTIATGQSTSKFRSSFEKAHIRIWRSDTLQTLRYFGSGSIHLSVTFLAFVPQKNHLISVDQSLDREIALWDIESGTQISNNKLNTEMVCVLLFHPNDHELIVTGGKEHLSWWKISEKGAILPHGKAVYGSHLRARFITCAAHDDRGDLITGDSNGTIYVWNTNDYRLLNMAKHAHAGPVLDLIIHRNSVISSGKDHAVKNWLIEKYMDSIGEITIPEHQGCVRVLKKYNGLLLMGTTFNSIYYFELNKKGHPFDPPIDISTLTFSSKNGIQCLLPMLDDGSYMTIGRDSTVAIYNGHERKLEWHCAMDGLNVDCADSTRDGSLIVMATKNGTISGFKLERQELIENQEEQEPVTKIVYQMIKTIEETQLNEWRVQPSFVKISPDKTLVAIAGYDFDIHLARYENITDPETEEEKTIFVVDRLLSGHTGVIIGIDWSITEPWSLRSYDEERNTKYWKLETLTEEPAKEYRNSEWASEHCRNSYKMAGIWKTKNVKQSGIASLSVNHKKDLVVMGDNEGCISMSRFPASNDGPFTHTYKCGLNRVQLVGFCPDDKFVISNSDDDTSVMQWKVL